MITKKEDTEKLIEEFDRLCEKYSCDEIDVELLKKKVIEVIDGWSD